MGNADLNNRDPKTFNEEEKMRWLAEPLTVYNEFGEEIGNQPETEQSKQFTAYLNKLSDEKMFYQQEIVKILIKKKQTISDQKSILFFKQELLRLAEKWDIHTGVKISNESISDDTENDGYVEDTENE